MSIPQEAIRKAWAAKKDEIERTFATAEAKGGSAGDLQQLPDYDARIPDVGLCHDGARSASTYWKSEGDTALSVRGLCLWTLNEPKQQEPIFAGDASSVVLPIGFSLLEVRGNFTLGATCVCYGLWGIRMNSQARSASGHLFQSLSAGSINFTLGTAGARLSCNNVSISGAPSMKAAIDSDLPEWLQAFGSVMSGHDINRSISSSMVNMFKTAPLAQRLVDSLNQAIGHGHA